MKSEHISYAMRNEQATQALFWLNNPAELMHWSMPKPRTNLTRFHGVFTPNSKFRVRVTPAKRGRGRKRRQPTGENWLDKTPA